MAYKEEVCKGCYIYENCSIPALDGDKMCPCLNCLVKVVCYESCEALVKYARDSTLSTPQRIINESH